MATYALNAITSQRRAFFSKSANAELLMQLMLRYRDEGRYLLHGFAIMPAEIHLLLTPVRERTAERCVQFVQAGFAAKVRMQIPGEVWQPGFREHRIRDENDFRSYLAAIAALPERHNLREYPFVHTHHLQRIDPMPMSLLHRSTGIETRARI